MKAVSEARDDRALLAAAFVCMASTSVVFPLLAALQDAHDLPTAALGPIAAGPYFAAVVVQVGVARIAHLGDTRRLLRLGLVLAALSLLGMATGTTLWHFVVARSLAGFAIGCFLPAARAVAAGIDDMAPARGLGRLSGAELAGLVAGPAAGATLATVAGIDATFLTFAVLALGAALVVGGRLPEAHQQHQAQAGGADRFPAHRGDRAPERWNRNEHGHLRSRSMLGAVLLVVAIEYPVGMFEAVWARYLLDRGASDLFVGLSVATFGVPFIVLATRGGALADRMGPARASACASLVVAPVIASYGFAHRPGVIAALAAVEACLQAVAIPAARAAIVVASPPDRVMAGQAIAGAAGLFATATAALVAPVVYDASGPRAMCVSVATVVVVSVLISLAVTRGSQSTHGPATRRPYGDEQWRGAGTTKHGRS